MLHMKVDVAFDLHIHLCLRHAAAGPRVPLAPKPVRTDVDKGHVRIAVISRGHRFEQVFKLGQENRIGERGIPERAGFAHPFAVIPEHALRTGLFHPLRRGVPQPALRTGDAERHAPAARDPALRRRVQDGPVEHALFGLKIRPRNAQIHHRAAGEPVERVRRLKLRPVIARDVGVEMHRPPHAGVEQRAPVILRPQHDPLLRPQRAGQNRRAHPQPPHRLKDRAHRTSCRVS
ncbi:MAG: hypothetical protein BWX70_02103 [Verrucomicrobia bacterium ADurb.Bin070]|nr:MAG: hypothetical protein BWX70_02103 [Verrucomicrobia bacterium ADurb.Bin070]